MDTRTEALRICPLPPPIHSPEDYTFTLMFEEYEDLCWKNVSYRVRNESDSGMLAEDIVQEAFTYMWTVWKEGRVDKTKIRSFVAINIANHFNMWHRRFRGEGSPNFESINMREKVEDNQMEGKLFSYSDCILDPSEIYEREVFFQEKRDIISTLPFDAQFLINRHFIEGVALSDVADEMGIKYMTILKRLERIRKRLGSFEDNL